MYFRHVRRSRFCWRGAMANLALKGKIKGPPLVVYEGPFATVLRVFTQNTPGMNQKLPLISPKNQGHLRRGGYRPTPCVWACTYYWYVTFSSVYAVDVLVRLIRVRCCTFAHCTRLYHPPLEASTCESCCWRLHHVVRRREDDIKIIHASIAGKYGKSIPIYTCRNYTQ